MAKVWDGDGAVIHPRDLDAPHADKATRCACFGMSAVMGELHPLSFYLLCSDQNIITI